jgi:hypothetical protein
MILFSPRKNEINEVEARPVWLGSVVVGIGAASIPPLYHVVSTVPTRHPERRLHFAAALGKDPWVAKITIKFLGKPKA